MEKHLRIDVRRDEAGLYFERSYLHQEINRAHLAKYRARRPLQIQTDFNRLEGIFESAFNRQSGWTEALAAWGQDRFQACLPEELQEEFKALDRATVTWILCCSEAALFPWELLYDGSRFLARKFIHGRLLEGENRKIKAVPNTSGKVLILADLEGSLAWAREEGCFIKDYLVSNLDTSLGTSMLNAMPECIGEAGREKALLELQRAGFVHYCGHSTVSDKAGKTGWVLSNGEILNIQDIQELGRREKVPALIFSNSCNSGRGHLNTADTLSGIAGAFLSAGVLGYIGSITRIEDGSAREFARTFYQSLNKNQPFASTLHQIQSQCPLDNPIWAAFRYYGDPYFHYAGDVEKTGPVEAKSVDKTPVEVPIKPGSPKKKTTMIPLMLGLLLLIALFLLGWYVYRKYSAPKGNWWYQEGAQVSGFAKKYFTHPV